LRLSPERLGGLLGVTYQQIQKYERGADRIGSSRLHDLCRVLGVPVGYFFDEAAPMATAP
jgi:transcriptional regulator with XRE-family HTH domain